jgi:hypothetical protein
MQINNTNKFGLICKVIIQYQEKDSKLPPTCATTAKMYVGKYFTTKGEFDEVKSKNR